MSQPDEVVPDVIAFDPIDACLYDAATSRVLACDGNLRSAGIGGEIAARWNAHLSLLTRVEAAEGALWSLGSACEDYCYWSERDTGGGAPDQYESMKKALKSARLALRASGTREGE